MPNVPARDKAELGTCDAQNTADWRAD